MTTMTFVFDVMRGKIVSTPIFGLNERLSANFSVHPRRLNAFAVETKVYEGRMTSSPGFKSAKSADISRASVHEFVRKTVSEL